MRLLRASWAGVHVVSRMVTVALSDGGHVRIWVGAADVEGVFDAYRLVAVAADSLSELDARTAADDETHDIPRSEFPSSASHFDASEDLALPGNDIVLFTGVSWSEPAPLHSPSRNGAGAEHTEVPHSVALHAGATPTSTMHFSGHPGQLTESAELVCITTDAVVIAASTGEGILIRTGLAPYTLQVARDAETIAAFLRERAYASE